MILYEYLTRFLNFILLDLTISFLGFLFLRFCNSNPNQKFDILSFMSMSRDQKHFYSTSFGPWGDSEPAPKKASNEATSIPSGPFLFLQDLKKWLAIKWTADYISNQ